MKKPTRGSRGNFGEVLLKRSVSMIIKYDDVSSDALVALMGFLHSPKNQLKVRSKESGSRYVMLAGINSLRARHTPGVGDAPATATYDITIELATPQQFKSQDMEVAQPFACSNHMISIMQILEGSAQA